MKNKVEGMYSILNAKWYDPFKKIWNLIVARKAEEQLQEFIKSNIDENKDVLELGCGTAINLEKIFKLGLSFKNYLGLDITQSMLNIAQNKFQNHQNVKFEKADITNLNLDKKYDIILCTWVISHLHNPVKFVNETQKYLKPGGKFFLIFYTKPKWYFKFWFTPIAKFLFLAESFDKKIISDFNNVKTVKSFTSDLVTIVEIKCKAT